ncbi:MAG: P-loop NTPase fold protein [Sulfuricurvum sp.]|nr:P-loop NTPase fold protein [Sulfuricurvum sp.]
MSKKIKLYEEHFPPYLEGGQVSIYLNNQLLEEVVIPSPDLSAEKMSDSTNFEISEFEDGNGNSLECEIFSSYYEVYVLVHLMNSQDESLANNLIDEIKVIVTSYETDYSEVKEYNQSFEVEYPDDEINCFAVRYKFKQDIEQLFQKYQEKDISEIKISDLSKYHNDVKKGSLVFMIAGGRAGDTNLREQGIYSILKVTEVGDKDPLNKNNYYIVGKFIYFFKIILKTNEITTYPGMVEFPYIGNKRNIGPAITILTQENLESVLWAASNITNEPMNAFLRFFPWLKKESNIGNNLFKNSIDKLPVGLNADKIAAVFGEYIINHNSDSVSAMIGIFGKWGRGKTTFYEEVEIYIAKQIKNDLKHNTCRFQPWKYHKREEAWAYLYQTIFQKYLLGDSAGRWAWLRSIKLNLKRLGWLRPVWFGLVIIFSTILAFISLQEKIHFIIVLFAIIGIPSSIIIYKFYKIFVTNKHAATTLYKDYVKFDGFKDSLGFQNEIQEELKTLLKVYIPNPNKEKLILFVDDLDRCEEKMIIDIIDTLRLMLDDDEIRTRVKVIAAIDERILEKAIVHKYANTSDNIISAKEYIEKFFLVGIKLNRLSQYDVEKLIDMYIGEINNIGEMEKKNNNDTIDQIANNFNEATRQNTSSVANIPLKKVTTPTVVYDALSDKSIDLTISNDEKKYIFEKMKMMVEPTPRKINIYIHRYLLFKALAHALFGDEKYNRLEHQLFIELIFTISDPAINLRYYYACSTGTDTVKNPVFGYEGKNINKAELIILLQIAEMVSPF